ncbi:hypothetical protein [Flavobacterium poyangense]|uniref:hypothetical protein n=1 Tax=Flavobacterium poyangense TaxID=2204302 RepID=UPI001421809E|nr:hypothetical protein [Flavobacterium sp. JXAS1]
MQSLYRLILNDFYLDEMQELLIESKGIKTDQYYIPPFELREGEVVIIYLQAGPFFDILKEQLTAIFTGKVQHENVRIIKPLTFAEPFHESTFKRIFNPVTVNRYLRKNANLNSVFLSEIFAIDAFAKKDKVKNLDTSQQKRLSLCSVFSKTRNIVFDLRGEGALYFAKTYKFVKDEIKNGGAAILIDWSNELKNDCSKFITLEWLVNTEELMKIGNGTASLSRMY